MAYELDFIGVNKKTDDATAIGIRWKNPDGSFTIDGLAAFSDVSELLGLSASADAFDTLNGFLTSLLGRILNDGETEKIYEEGYCFSILKVEEKMIREVHAAKAENKEETAEKLETATLA